MGICQICKNNRNLTTHHKRHGGIMMICVRCHRKVNKHQRFSRSGKKEMKF